jgi:hypothetical protein
VTNKLHENEQRDIKLANDEDAFIAERRRLSSSPGEDRAARAAKIARGESFDSKPTAEKIRELDSKILDIRAARAILADERNELRKAEEQQTRETYKDAVFAEYRQMAPALVQVLASLQKVENIKSALLARGFGFSGVPCAIDTDRVFAGSPFDKASELALLLRQFVELGLISKVPGVR